MKQDHFSVEELLVFAIDAAINAGRSIMEVYNETKIDYEIKSDLTPLTRADKKAHETIEGALKNSGLPVLSEEGIQYTWDEREHWTRFWLVDPLDGTKEFIKKNGEFTVNIALIENEKPIMGVVYAPVFGIMYHANDKGAFKTIVPELSETGIDELLSNSLKLPVTEIKEKMVVAGSRSHFNNETNDFILHFNRENKPVEMVHKGSSLKLCMVAEGTAHLYPRFGPTMEWDTAAGHAILLKSGKQIFSQPDNLPLKYNKKNLYNPSFYAC